MPRSHRCPFLLSVSSQPHPVQAVLGEAVQGERQPWPCWRATSPAGSLLAPPASGPECLGLMRLLLQPRSPPPGAGARSHREGLPLPCTQQAAPRQGTSTHGAFLAGRWAEGRETSNPKPELSYAQDTPEFLNLKQKDSVHRSGRSRGDSLDTVRRPSPWNSVAPSLRQPV